MAALDVEGKERHQAVWEWLADAIVVMHLAYLAFVPFVLRGGRKSGSC